jgi:hypothetical protein
MSNTVGTIDINSIPELRDLVKEVEETKQPKALTRDNKVVAVLSPVGTEAISLGAAGRDETPNEYFKEAAKRAREHRKQGKGSPIFTDEEALIRKDTKTYRRIDTMDEWLRKQGV